MKSKKIVSLALATAFLASTALSGCGAASSSESGSASSESTKTAESSSASVSHDEELTLEVYDVAANYQGEQIGWFGKVLKDKFNIKLNILAPQVSGGDQLYQSRSAAGNLGDIILLDNNKMQDCVDAGLILDLGDYSQYTYLAKFKEQIDLFNGKLKGGENGAIYAIPTEMNTNGPTGLVRELASSAPRVPWDYFNGVGAPAMETSDDLLTMLSDMQNKYPTNTAGDKAYAISMWKDWDGSSIENANIVAKWFGQEVKESVLLGADDSIVSLTDDNGAYHKALELFFKANQQGLVDPDSATQDWATVNEKQKQKRVYLFWYDWQNGFWNTADHGNSGENFMYTPVDELNIYQTADPYYGSGRVWGIGSGVDDDKKARIMELFDWMCSPEGLTIQHTGLKDLIYTVNDDGKTFTLTQDGIDRFTKTITVPDEMGGGNVKDGGDQLNQWIVGSQEIDTDNGENFNSDFWATSIERNKTKTSTEWSAKFDGAKNELDYLQKNNKISVVPFANIPLESDNSDISLIRGQCKSIVCDSSWKMVFAKDQAEFDKIWASMKTDLDGMNWKTLVEFDTKKYQVVMDDRKAAK